MPLNPFSACCFCLWIPLDSCLSRAGNGLVFVIPDGQVLVLFSFDLSQTLGTHSLFEILPPPKFPTPYYTGFLFPQALPSGSPPTPKTWCPLQMRTTPAYTLSLASWEMHCQSPLQATCLSSACLPSVHSDCPHPWACDCPQAPPLPHAQNCTLLRHPFTALQLQASSQPSFSFS